MERVIEFRNFTQLNNIISADFYVDGKFLLKLSGDLEHLTKSEDTDIGLYEYFRKAILGYIDGDCFIYDPFVSKKPQ